MSTTYTVYKGTLTLYYIGIAEVNYVFILTLEDTSDSQDRLRAELYHLCPTHRIVLYTESTYLLCSALGFTPQSLAWLSKGVPSIHYQLSFRLSFFVSNRRLKVS